MRGVILYEIMDDGCINGEYINTDVSENKYWEHAVKKDTENKDNTLVGKYYCAYIEDGKILTGDLEITKEGYNYSLKWKYTKEDIHCGIGILSKDSKYLAVSYWYGETK